MKNETNKKIPVWIGFLIGWTLSYIIFTLIELL